MTTERLTRRQAIRAAAIGAFALAGCSQTDGQQTAGDSTASHSESEHSEDTESSGHEDSHGGTEHDGEGSHHEGGNAHGTVGEPTDAAEVAMQTTEDGNHFAPHVVRVHEGGTVTFVNESGAHTSAAYHPDNDRPALVPDGAASWESGTMSSEGAEFEHTFATPGVYHYYCRPHESVGMVGTVIVGDPDPHDQSALGDPPESLPEEARHKIESLNERCNEILGHAH